MKARYLMLLALWCAVAVPIGQQAGSAESALEAARKTAVVDGDLAAAIKQYQAVVDRFANTDRAAAAQALLRIAEAYQKLGNVDAIKTLERIVSAYPDQTATASDARARLGAIQKLSGSSAAGAIERTSGPRTMVVCSDCNPFTGSFPSPDGAWIAFTTREFDLAIRDISTGQTRPLMSRPVDGKAEYRLRFPVMSPDARQVVYLQMRSTTGFGRQGATSQLRLAANEPGALSRVLVDNPEYTVVNPTAWSPDGKSILVEIEHRDATWQIAWVSVANGAVQTLKSLNWRHRYEYADRPALSPDGRFIAYSAFVNERPSASAPATALGMRIYLLAADGSSESALAEPAGYYGYPVWTRDGSALLYLSDRRSGQPIELDLWAISVRDGKAEGTPSMAKPNIGRAGTMILGMTTTGALYYNYNVPPSTGGRGAESFQQVGIQELPRADVSRRGNLRTTLGFGWGPNWSPDGRSVAFRRLDDNAVVVHSVATGEQRTLSDWSEANWLQWLSDGSGFLSAEADNDKHRLVIRRWDLANGESRQVVDVDTTGFDLDEDSLLLSSDEKVAYFFASDGAPGDGRIVSFDLQSRKLREVWRRSSTSVELYRESAVSSDGARLALLLCACRAQQTLGSGPPVQMLLATVNADGTDYREIYGPFRRAPGSASPLTWTNDGHLIFAAAEGNTNRLMRINANGGQPQSVGFTPDGIFGAPTISRDGSRIAYRFRPSWEAELWSLDLSRFLQKMR